MRCISVRVLTACLCLPQAIQEEAAGAQRKWKKKHRIKRLRTRISTWYESVEVQMVVTLVIMCNFVTEAFRLQLRPDLPGQEQPALVALFDQLEVFFTVFFTVEICINLAGTPT